MQRIFMYPALRVAAAAIAWFACLQAHATSSNTGESSEIVFCNGGTAPYTGCAAAQLRAMADSLGTPVAIFEYVRNNYDASLYQGARSGSVNTFLGGRGNDVDTDATLIAMLRSQGIPAHYVVGTVRVPASKVENWLQVEDPTLAQSLLTNEGIQKVASSTLGTTASIDFEHVWVEALVPFGNYRGEAVSTVNCAATPTPTSCHWVPMDPSWKQYTQVASGLDPYTALTSSFPTSCNVSGNTSFFDYGSYYCAIVNADAARMNKNPLEIYQNQVLAWLQTTAPGKTLDDVPDFRGIVTETDGLLPASLPYAVVSAMRIYNAVADHDAVVPATEVKKWSKSVSVGLTITATVTGGGTVTLNVGGVPVLLTDAAIQRLTLATEIVGGIPNVIVRLGGTVVATPIAGGGTIVGYTPANGDPFSLTVTMDGPPDPTGGANDTTIQATYQAMIGGYYLIATGGESSNWSQVHRAAQQLISATAQYPIVVDANLNAYVDVNGTGVYATNDPALATDLPAMDALTGGLLYVAATQYFAKLHDDFTAAGRLNKVITPISGFLGVVSSTYQPAEYIGSTAFGVLPSGLLIDMKGITIGGNWRINAPATVSDAEFNFIGHITSSLEHETWQELTGYDAVSTVRGIQTALANGATLVNPVKNSTTDTVATAYSAFGFTIGAAPTGFTYTPFNLFGTQPATWTNATSGASFDLMLAQETTATSALRQSRATYTYSTGSGLYAWVSCVNGQLAQLNSYIAQGLGSYSATITFCDGSSATNTITNLVSALQTDYLSTVVPIYIGQTFFNYFDAVQGFAPASYIYRNSPCTNTQQFSSFVQQLRDNMYLQTLSSAWVEYLLPSIQTVGPTYKFAVDVRKAHTASTGNLISETFEIQNNTGIAAGGGYVAAPAGAVAAATRPF